MKQQEMWTQAANGQLSPTKIHKQIKLVAETTYEATAKLIKEGKVDHLAAIIDGHINSMLNLCVMCTNGKPPSLGHMLEPLAMIYLKHIPIQIARHQESIQKQQEVVDED